MESPSEYKNRHGLTPLIKPHINVEWNEEQKAMEHNVYSA